MQIWKKGYDYNTTIENIKKESIERLRSGKSHIAPTMGHLIAQNAEPENLNPEEVYVDILLGQEIRPNKVAILVRVQYTNDLYYVYVGADSNLYFMKVCTGSANILLNHNNLR